MRREQVRIKVMMKSRGEYTFYRTTADFTGRHPVALDRNGEWKRLPNTALICEWLNPDNHVWYSIPPCTLDMLNIIVGNE